jgi:serine/threonine-protein kinase
MAPEQMRSAKDVDTRADIWSLGAMLYEMLTGQPPYTGESIPQLCAALLHDDPIPLRQHRPEIPEGLEQAVLRCLMKNRDDRFPTVGELGRALLPFALADSRIHVERAERVLGATDVTMSGMSPMTARPSLPQSGVAAASVPITPLNVTPIAVMEPTVNSWGGSGLVPAPKRRGPLFAIAGVAAVFAAAGGLWAARSSSTPESKAPAPATSPSVEVAKADAKAPVLAPPPEVTAAPDTSPSGSAGLAGMPASPVSALPATNAKTKAALVASPKTATKKAEPKKPDIAAPPPARTGGVTDFGGRR